MEPPPFTTETFKGRTGYIDEVVSEFVRREHLNHYHVTMHQGNTALGEWGKRAIRDPGRPVLSVGPSSNGLFPEDALPDEEIGERPYRIEGNRVLVRLDRLPFRYDHQGAVYGGLGMSKRFMAQYQQLKTSLEQDIKQYDFSDNPAIEQLKSDPSILTGVQLSVFPEGPPWKNILFYAMRQLGIWDDSFNSLQYSQGDNCIELYPQDFNYGLLVPVIKEFGGWIDFMPGSQESGSRPSMMCNFTASGKGEKGLAAIVQSASISGSLPLTEGQNRFRETVFRAFDSYNTKA